MFPLSKKLRKYPCLTVIVGTREIFRSRPELSGIYIACKQQCRYNSSSLFHILNLFSCYNFRFILSQTMDLKFSRDIISALLSLLLPIVVLQFEEHIVLRRLNCPDLLLLFHLKAELNSDRSYVQRG